MAKEKTEAEKAEAKANAEAKAKAEDEKLLAEAKELGLTKSRVSLAGFKTKKNIKPEEIVREEARVAKKAMSRLAKNVAKAKVRAKMKPIERRLALLVSRFKAVISRTRPHTYSEKIIAAWTEEYNLIKNGPRSWNKLTLNGTKPFIPGNKKKKTPLEVLDEMDLE